MAFENPILDLSFEAAEDLSNDQYRFVVLSGSGVRRPDSATEVPLGVLQNAPESGEAAVVRVDGITKVEAGEALSVGDYVKAEYVSAADAGKAQDAAGELQCVRGVVVQSAGAEGDLASIRLMGPNPQRVTFSVDLPALTANTSVYVGCIAAGRSMRITKVSIACKTAPSDADGACTLALTKYDVSASADKNLLGSASFDLEGLTAKTAEDLTLTSTAADLVVDATDYVFATLTNDSAGIDTNMAGGVLTIEADLL